MKANARLSLAVIGFFLLLLTAGCAALSTLTTKPEPLEERVKQYMQAQIDGKWDRAWSFFDAASREKTPRERFVNLPRKLFFTGYAIKEITMLPEDKATVKVTYDLIFMGYAFKDAPKTHNWVKEGGAWYVKDDSATRRTPFDKPPEKQK